jgi:hypothetical protein
VLADLDLIISFLFSFTFLWEFLDLVVPEMISGSFFVSKEWVSSCDICLLDKKVDQVLCAYRGFILLVFWALHVMEP